jgi:uncharacterized membrane protein YphA (DoxX/SURF4 family)
MRVYVGRHVYGLAAIIFGVITLVWQGFSTWQQNVPHGAIFVYLAAATELFGGLAIQWWKTARIGATALGCLYLVFALSWVPRIAKEPLVYDRWGNFFEQFSILSGALIVYAWAGRDNPERAAKLARVGYIFFGICVVSFMLGHIFYLSAVVEFVPKWIPPGRMFWAVTTTVAFALAATSLLSGHSALLASQLLTVMLLGFGFLVWLPKPFVDPHQIINWGGNAQNLAITGAAWIVVDHLRRNGSTVAAERAT